MIQDYQTNKVYLAEGLKNYMPMYMNLLEALSAEDISVSTIPRTKSAKHVWARDYMPIQLSKDKYLLYLYYPDYLQDDEDYIPDFPSIVKDMHLDCVVSNLVLDGGNVVKCGNKVIMTDKIFQENPKYYKHALIDELEKLMDAQIVLIPWDRYEMFGHADGMVRYISRDVVLMNNYSDFDPGFGKRLVQALEPHFYVEMLGYDTPRCSRLSWAYLNFLQVKGCIFVPGLRVKEDKLAIKQIQDFYPDHKVIRIDNCQDLVRDGGALNCISWNIETDEPARYSRDVPKNNS